MILEVMPLIEVTHNVRTNEITVSGHAGYAEPGKDIVCAAVSVLGAVGLHPEGWIYSYSLLAIF